MSAVPPRPYSRPVRKTETVDATHHAGVGCLLGPCIEVWPGFSFLLRIHGTHTCPALVLPEGLCAWKDSTVLNVSPSFSVENLVLGVVEGPDTHLIVFWSWGLSLHTTLMSSWKGTAALKGYSTKKAPPGASSFVSDFPASRLMRNFCS